MKLNFDQIKSITLGAARVTEEANGFRFFRFTEEQEDYYRPNGDFLYKTFAGSGIMLEFVTDSKHISLEVETSLAASRKYVFFDLYCNGIAIDHLGSRDTVNGIFGNSYTLIDGVKTVQLYFPWSAKTLLRYLALDDGAQVIPTSRPKKILIFGDSITQGYDMLYPSRSYANVLAQKLNAEARNKGIGGEFFCPGLLTAEGEDFIPDYITVAYGTNDWACKASLADVEEPARAFYQKLSALYPNAKIFAISPIWRTTEREKKATCAFSELPALIERVTAHLDNVTVINGYNLIPHDKACLSDGVHPNDTGAAYYAERLWAKILPLI